MSKTNRYPSPPLDANGNCVPITAVDMHSGNSHELPWLDFCDVVIADQRLTEEKQDEILKALSSGAAPMWLDGGGMEYHVGAPAEPTYPDAPIDAATGQPVMFECHDAATGLLTHSMDWASTIAHLEGNHPDHEEAAAHLAAGTLTSVACSGTIVKLPAGVQLQGVPVPVNPADFQGEISEALSEEFAGATDDLEFESSDHSHLRRKRAQVSQTCFNLEQWGIRKGQRLAQDDQYKPHVKAGLIDEHVLADLHAACFEPYVEMAEVPKDPDRQKWLQALLEAPEFKSLRAQTALDVLLSDIACINVSEQWVEYRKITKEREATDKDRMKSAAKAAENAKDQVEECNGIARSFGLDASQRSMRNPQELLKMFRRIRENRQLKRICELAGKYRMMAQAKQRVKDHYGLDEVTDIEVDGDLSRLIGSELSQLGVPELEWDVIRRVCEKQVLCRKHSGVKHVARGPIMVLIDESGSMSGEPIAQAKALALALAWVAKAQGRWCSLVSWSHDGCYNHISLPPGGWDADGVANWCCGFIGGGTQPPINHIQTIYDGTKAPDGKTDLIWISDGDAHVPDADAAVFNQWRHDHKAKSVTLLVDQHDEAFKKISDTVHKIKRIDVNEEAIGEILGL